MLSTEYRIHSTSANPTSNTGGPSFQATGGASTNHPIFQFPVLGNASGAYQISRTGGGTPVDQSGNAVGEAPESKSQANDALPLHDSNSEELRRGEAITTVLDRDERPSSSPAAVISLLTFKPRLLLFIACVLIFPLVCGRGSLWWPYGTNGELELPVSGSARSQASYGSAPKLPRSCNLVVRYESHHRCYQREFKRLPGGAVSNCGNRTCDTRACKHVNQPRRAITC